MAGNGCHILPRGKQNKFYLLLLFIITVLGVLSFYVNKQQSIPTAWKGRILSYTSPLWEKTSSNKGNMEKALKIVQNVPHSSPSQEFPTVSNFGNYLRVSIKDWKQLLFNETFIAFIDHHMRLMGPYVPINVAFIKVSQFLRDEEGRKLPQFFIQMLVTEIINTGFGSQTIMTNTSSEYITEENGVQFRQYGSPNKNNKTTEKDEIEVYIPFKTETFFEGKKNNWNASGTERRKIILWHDKPLFWPVIPELRPLRFCPEFPCVITTNRTHLANSAGVVFAITTMSQPPVQRSPGQVYILHNQEPAKPGWVTRNIYSPEWTQVFNWTITYRLDSDIIDSYGLIRRRKAPVQKDYRAIVANKTKMAAWMVSHCGTHSEREKYVRELKKYIQVDVFGKCGPFKCARKSDDQCFEVIQNTYRFYLSFENAFCTDYITEKFFRFYGSNTVLIARGSDTYYKHVPPSTFINTADFASPKELAQRLLQLSRHDEEYIQMLKEKDKYISIFEDYIILDMKKEIYIHYRYGAVPLCEVCQKLWNLEKYAKTVPNTTKWFNKELCYKPTDL